MTDYLALTANERVDLADLSFACFDSQFATQRLLPSQVLTNPATPQMWVLAGFAPTNPSAMLVTVARGVALLCYRSGATLNYGAIAAEGDATKTLDASTLSAGSYTLYIGFQVVPTAQGSRAVWNPATASEGAVSQPVRMSANWQLRAELANPGAEYLPIATMVVAPGSVTLTDVRPFYFEGAANAGFAQSWGSGANDRSADRANNGVRDFRTFTDAMKTCLEDIKGPGIARWYSNMVAGQTIGFAGTPVLGRTQWSDALFFAQGSSTAPAIGWGTGAQQSFTRASNTYAFGAPGGSTSWTPASGWSSTLSSATAPGQQAFSAYVSTSAAASFGAANGMAVPGYGTSVTGAYAMSQGPFYVFTGLSTLAAFVSTAGLMSVGAGTTPASALHVRGSSSTAGVTVDAGSTASQFQVQPSANGGTDGGPSVALRDTTSNANFLRYTRGTQNIDFPQGNGPILPASSQPVKMTSNVTTVFPINPFGQVVAGTLAYNLQSYNGTTPLPNGPNIAPNASGVAQIILPVHLPYAATLVALNYNVGRIRSAATASTVAATYTIALYSTGAHAITPWVSAIVTTASYTPVAASTQLNAVNPGALYLPAVYSQDTGFSNGESFWLQVTATNLQSTDYLAIGQQAMVLAVGTIGTCIAG